MESRGMELTLISASDLKNPNLSSTPKAYAVAWISNDSKNKQRTQSDKSNGTNPTWNQKMRFNLDEDDLQKGCLYLKIAIYTKVTSSEKEMGRVTIALNKFLKSTTSAQTVSLKVQKPGENAKGFLKLSVKLAEKSKGKQRQYQPQKVAGSYGEAKAEPVTAYSAGSDGAVKAEHAPYPPWQQCHPPTAYPVQPANTPTSPYHHGYPPNQGYPPYHWNLTAVPAAQQPPRNNNILGMGMWVVGRTLGAFLAEEIGRFFAGVYDVGDFGDDGLDLGF